MFSIIYLQCLLRNGISISTQKKIDSAFIEVINFLLHEVEILLEYYIITVFDYIVHMYMRNSPVLHDKLQTYINLQYKFHFTYNVSCLLLQAKQDL